MPIEVACPACGHKWNVADDRDGETLTCPRCGKGTEAVGRGTAEPASPPPMEPDSWPPAETVGAECDSCGHRWDARVRPAIYTTSCPRCLAPVTIRWQPAAPRAASGPPRPAGRRGPPLSFCEQLGVPALAAENLLALLTCIGLACGLVLVVVRALKGQYLIDHVMSVGAGHKTEADIWLPALLQCLGLVYVALLVFTLINIARRLRIIAQRDASKN